MLNKDNRFAAKLDHALKNVDDDLKQDLHDFVSDLKADVLKAKPEVIKWLVNNIEPAVLAFISYFTDKLK